VRRARVLEARRERKDGAEPGAERDVALWLKVQLTSEEKQAVLVERLPHLRCDRSIGQTGAQADPRDLGAQAR